MTTGIRAGASASEIRLALVEEAVWGTTPATPAFVNTRLTSESLMPSKTTVRSNEIRPDRNVVDEIMVGRAVAGTIGFELSYAAFDNLIESLMFADWSSDIIKNGAGAGTAFTAERRVPLPAGGYDYQRFLGLVVNSMSLNISAGALISGEFGLMGKFGGRSGSLIAGATYAEAPQNRILNAVNNFAELTIGGVSPSPRIRSLTLSITNNMRAQDEIGNLDAAGMAAGRFEVTGFMQAYFENGSLLQSFLDHEDLSLSFVIGDETGSRYLFTIPTIVLTGDPGGNATANDDDIMQTLNFTAVLDRTSSPLLGCTLQIERGY